MYVYPYLRDGPSAAIYSQLKDPCIQYWWTNLLYINNLVPWPAGSECYGVTWYLANDMQFHVISPLIILLLVRRRHLGFGLISVLMGGSLAARVATGVHFDLTSSLASAWEHVPILSAFYVSWLSCAVHHILLPLLYFIARSFNNRLNWGILTNKESHTSQFFVS